MIKNKDEKKLQTHLCDRLETMWRTFTLNKFYNTWTRGGEANLGDHMWHTRDFKLLTERRLVWIFTGTCCSSAARVHTETFLRTSTPIVLYVFNLVDFKQLGFLNITKCAQIPQTPNMTRGSKTQHACVLSVCNSELAELSTTWMRKNYSDYCKGKRSNRILYGHTRKLVFKRLWWEKCMSCFIKL